jgi:hypothetical protein
MVHFKTDRTKQSVFDLIRGDENHAVFEMCRGESVNPQ